MIALRTQLLKVNRTFLIILGISLLIRILYLWSYHNLPDWYQLTIDNNYHVHWAEVIASGNILGDTTYFRAPFYVYCLAFLYAVFGTSLWVARLFGLLVGVASVSLTYLIGKKLFDKKTGLIAAGIHSMYPIVVYFESELLLDSLFMFLVQFTFYRLLIWIEQPTKKQAFIIGLFLGLAAITRPTILVLVPLLLITAGIYRKKITAFKMQLLVFFLGTVLFIAPVFIRNLLVAGDPVLIASQGGINFYIGNNEVADGVSAIMPEPMGFNWRIRHVVYIAEKAEGRTLTPGEVSSYWTKQGVTWIRNHPLDFITLYGKKLYYNISNREISNNRDFHWFFQKIPLLKYNPLGFGLLLIFSVIALGTGVLRDKRTWMLLAFMILYIAAGALFFFNSRYRLPLLPYYFIFAAAGAQNIVGICKQSHTKCGVLVVVGLITGFMTFYNLVPLPPGPSTYAMTSTGLYYYEKNDFSKALFYHQKALAIDSTYPEVNLNVGVDFLRLGQVDSARYYFQREYKFNPNRINAIVNLASLELLHGDPGKAVSYARNALAKLPYDVVANAILLRGLFAIDNDKLPDSVLYQEAQATAQRTNNDVYLLNDAALLLTERNMYRQAELILLQALSSKPPPIEMDDEAFRLTFRNSPQNIKQQKAKAAYQLGYIMGLRGDFHRAITYSQQAIAWNPDLAEAYLNLISGLLSIGDRKAADSVIAAASKRFASNTHFMELLSRFPR